jgi:hypothetical protein
MGKATSIALAGALVLAGCGSSSPSSTLGTGGGTSSSTGSGGSGGGGGGAGGAGCGIASLVVDGDGPANHFNAACMGTYAAAYTAHANGYLAYTAPGSVDLQLDVGGCAESTAPLLDGSLLLTAPQTGVGSATMGTASYTNGTDTFTTDSAVTMMVTEITSALVKGSYTATVSSANSGMKMLSGTFSVCRVPNFTPP